MDRKEFIKTCGLACISGGLLTIILESCVGSKMVSGLIGESDLLVSLSDFEIMKGSEKTFKQYVIVHNEQLQFPICIYRHNTNDYSALWMRCTHQGAELQAFGNRLVCPAHGSEFSNRGQAQTGPADQSLRSFIVRQVNDQLKISLKQQ